MNRSLTFYGRLFCQVRWSSTSQSSSQRKAGLIQRLKSSWIPIPTGVGITLLAWLQWRRLERERKKELQIAKNWEVTCYKAVPLRSMSRIMGWFSERRLPEPLRPVVYRTYARTFGVDLDEVALPIQMYDCMGSFFTRALKDGCRPIDQHQSLVSPADGVIMNSGKLSSCHVEQVKGVTYSLQAFLGDVTWSRKKALAYETDKNNNLVSVRKKNPKDDWLEYKKQLLSNPKNELYQCVVYLAPGDYHRFHSPVNWQVNFRRHFQGELLSVSPRIAKWIPGLFTLNERAVYVGSWKHGYFSMTAVGATNVGSIRVYDDKMLHTNTMKWRDGSRHKDRRLNCSWVKGQEVGEFRMGSTLVLIFEAPADYFATSNLPKPGTRVKVGEALYCGKNKFKAQDALSSTSSSTSLIDSRSA